MISYTNFIKFYFQEAAKVLAWLRCRNEDDVNILNALDEISKEQLKDSEGSPFVVKSIGKCLIHICFQEYLLKHLI